MEIQRGYDAIYLLHVSAQTTCKYMLFVKVTIKSAINYVLIDSAKEIKSITLNTTVQFREYKQRDD